MVRVRLSDLDEAVKSFLTPTVQGEIIVVENDDGSVRCGITPYFEAAPATRQIAAQRLAELQKKAARSMDHLGVSEADLDESLQNGNSSSAG